MARGSEPADLVIRGTQFLDPAGGIAEGDVAIGGDRIVGTFESYRGRTEIDGRGLVVVPGFVDAHVHVESTLVTPAEFDRCVLPRGTTTAICDPHEIANVLGLAGLRWFLDSATSLALDLRVMLSSCVPATALETSGARLLASDLVGLQDHPAALGLAEVMNFPGLLAGDAEVLDKIVAFEDRPIDGHCPLLAGRDLNAYAACGIRNCHESTRPEEAREKMRKGMQVLLRDGSVSKDVERLAPLVTDGTWPLAAFCTDDRNPLDIAEAGHIDHLIRKAIRAGAPTSAVYRAATFGAARGFRLFDRGLVAPGYLADLVLLEDLETCAVRSVVRRGRLVDEATFAGRDHPPAVGRGSVRLPPVDRSVLAIRGGGSASPVIGVVPRSILTERLSADLPLRGGERHADPARDLLKVCVLARHGVNRNVGRGFVRGFGLRSGALASSVGHDSHNLIVVGANDDDMVVAVNRLIETQGGFAVAAGGEVRADLPLPIAGLMSDRPFGEVAERLRALRRAVRDLGCPLEEAFLQLAFLPLPVIPHLKITDRGLVDVDRFELVNA
jgi:adenine deaminase